MTREEFFYQCIDVIEHWLNGNRKFSELREVTDKLYNEVTKPQWISVEDKLPPMRDEEEMSDIILTHTKGGVIYINRYDYRGKTWGNPLAFNVTHWMPLPQPPTVAKNATVKKGGEHDTEE